MARQDHGRAVSEGPGKLSTGSAAQGLQHPPSPTPCSLWRRSARWIFNGFDVLFTGQCLLCHEACGPKALCAPCLRGLPPILAACPVCALPRGARGQACDLCRATPPRWRRTVAPLRYEYPVDRLIQRFKYQGELAAGAALTAAMLLGPRPSPPVRDGASPWLVPVPLHWTREWHRGFNQARELARDLSRSTGWPLADDLVRTRRTRSQARLAGEARRSNLRGAFRWRGPPLDGRRVVLVDDVLTTGATAEACAMALQDTKAKSVDLWVAARALPQSIGPSRPAAPSAHDRASGR